MFLQAHYLPQGFVLALTSTVAATSALAKLVRSKLKYVEKKANDPPSWK